MKNLYQKLSPANQNKIDKVDNQALLEELQTKEYFFQITARHLIDLAWMFDLADYKSSFNKTMLDLNELFSNVD